MKHQDLSFTAASGFPIKLIVNKSWLGKGGKIKPTHLQFIPTNRCPLRCSFCSCKDKDARLEIPFTKAKNEITKFARIGGRAITITGGGEPLAYPKINEIIDLCHKLDIKTGLVTNGVLWKNLKKTPLLTWCRISVSNENHIRDEWSTSIKNIPIDWAFSYVYTGDDQDMRQFLEKAIILPITHIRVVTDLYSLKSIPRFVKHEKIIYQDRDHFTKGTKKCWVSLVKPVLHADGYYYPCCGVQYAKNDSRRDMIPEMRCTRDLEQFYSQQVPFDGSVCDKCYYSQYNEILDLLKCKYQHLEFI